VREGMTVADGVQDLGEMGEPTADSLRQAGLEPPAPREPEPPAPAPAPPNSDLFVSLHVDSPAEGWGQQSNEAVFIGYARVPVTRASLVQALTSLVSVRFPGCRGGGLNIVTHIGIGTDPTGPGRMICSWRLSNSVTVTNGITVCPYLEPHLISNWRSELGLDEAAPVREQAGPPAPIEAARPRPPAQVEAPPRVPPLATRAKEVVTGLAIAGMCAFLITGICSFFSAERRFITDGLGQLARRMSDVYQVQRASDSFLEARVDEAVRAARRAEEAARRAERAVRRVNAQEAIRSR